jgi:hypothetical protein
MALTCESNKNRMNGFNMVYAANKSPLENLGNPHSEDTNRRSNHENRVKKYPYESLKLRIV